MSREDVARGAAPPRLEPWFFGALGLSAAIGAGLLIAQLLMSPPAADLRLLAAYLAISGVATMLGGWFALRGADRAVGLSIRARSSLGALIGSGVALLNIAIVAELMFVSTAHDLKLLIALVVFSAIVTTFFSVLTASMIVRRVDRITRTIRELARGDYGARLEVVGSDEIARLTDDVNGLARRLREAEEQRQALDRERRDLTAAISHDLRTPLASIQAMVEALADGVVHETEDVAGYYERMRREIERLSRMIDDLFELARLDAGAGALERRPVSLQEIAAEVVDAMGPQAERAGVRLALTVGEEPPPLMLDGARVERAASNLVQNALDHVRPGGAVDISVFSENGWVALRVSDDGDGIAEDDLPHIWERFYRAEKSRGRGVGAVNGAGLGLAIVRGIVEVHGGTVEGASKAGRGATFTVRLPATPAAATSSSDGTTTRPSSGRSRPTAR